MNIHGDGGEREWIERGRERGKQFKTDSKES